VALHEALRRFSRRRGDDDEPPPLPSPERTARLFVELNDDDAVRACTSLLRDLVEGGEEPSAYGPMGKFELTAYDSAWLDELVADDKPYEPDAIDTWLELVRRSARLTDEHFDPLFSALAESRIAEVVSDEPVALTPRPVFWGSLGMDVVSVTVKWPSPAGAAGGG